MKIWVRFRTYTNQEHDSFFLSGYYVHLNTFSEVREQVLNYIHVMARPLVLQKDHPVIWSEVYADVVVSIVCAHMKSSYH